MKAEIRLIGAVVIVVLLWAGVASAQDTLAAARQLYASASYDDALAMFDRLKSSGGDPAAASLIDRYRAFCLLAVGHQSDAEKAMAAAVEGDPTFRPDDAEVSPRLQSAYRDVRKRVLPLVVRQRYAAAKASFDQKAYQDALNQFDALLRLLESSDIVSADPSLTDLLTVASGFRDLAKAAVPPPLPAPSPAASDALPTASLAPSASGPAAASAVRPPPAYYTASDPGVTAPIVVRQALPQWPQGIPKPTQRGQRAVLDLVIDEGGTVESATIRQSITKWYDEMLVAEARRWRYKPATKDGKPVKYRMMIQVVLDK